jgi:two-component system chemotaxis response regulator CheY
MKFLVVDDSVTMRRIMINALQRIGYSDIVEAADGPRCAQPVR